MRRPPRRDPLPPRGDALSARGGLDRRGPVALSADEPKGSTALAALAGVCAALPMAFSRHLPFCDLPEHAAVVATLQHLDDPAFRAREYYEVAAGGRTPYLLFHQATALLARALDDAERATTAVLMLVAFALPFALRELLRALGRDPRLALAAAPLFWGRSLAEGLANYVATTPLVLVGLALAARQCEAPTRRRAVWLSLVALTTYYLHLSGALMLGAGAVALLVARLPERPRVLSVAWVVPTLVAALHTAARSSLTHPDPAQGPHAGRVRAAPVLLRLRELWGWMHDFWRTPWDDRAAVALWVALAVATLGRSRDTTERRQRRAGLALVVAAAGLFLLVPSQVGFGFLLDVRYATFLGLFAPLLATGLDGRVKRAVPAALAALAIASCALHATQMRGFDRDEAADIDMVLRNLPPGRRLLSLVFDARSDYTVVPSLIHVGAWYRVRAGGVASFSFAEIPHWPVQFRPGAGPPRKRIMFWDWRPCLFRNATDGAWFDFVLVRGELDPFAYGPPGPRWRLIGAARALRLWARVPGSWVDGDASADRGPCAHVQGLSPSP